MILIQSSSRNRYNLDLSLQSHITRNQKYQQKLKLKYHSGNNDDFFVFVSI